MPAMQEQLQAMPGMAGMPAMQEQLQAMPWMACMPAVVDDARDDKYFCNAEALACDGSELPGCRHSGMPTATSRTCGNCRLGAQGCRVLQISQGLSNPLAKIKSFVAAQMPATCAWLTRMSSIHQPCATTPESVPKRKRNWMLCPA